MSRRFPADIATSLHNHYAVLQVVKAKPSDADAKMKYTECNKIVKQMAFERAIRVDDTKKSVAESIKLENMGNCCVMCCCASGGVCYAYVSYNMCLFQQLRKTTMAPTWKTGR